MNDLSLDQRLRALRAPPPENGFEVRLAQALWREAHVQRVQRGSAPLSSARRVGRWGPRISLGVALALGATAAAAAAGGIWVVVTRSAERPLPPPVATPVAERAAPPRAPAALVPAPSEVAPPEPSPEQVAEPPAPLPVPEALPPAAASAKAFHEGAARPASSSSSAKPARSSPSASEASVPLAPFELPKRSPLPPTAAAPGRSPSAPAAADRSGSAAASERRVLPDVASRSERRRARPERPEKHDRAAWPPGREIARERSGRDNAERGLERAREVRGGK